MKTTKLIATSAVATAIFPLAAVAAIDDQGMQYVSAAEGLHGSLRVNILKNVDKDTSDETTGGSADSLRLWITGSGDIGNGWATTYYWEVRDGNRDADGNGEKDAGVIGTEAWTVGLKGPLGAFDFGRSAMVAPRMVPGGSLDTIVGGNAAHFACDVCDNTHRFESATFNGFQFGVSGVTNGDEGKGNSFTEDDLFDEYSFAVKYSSPLGFQVGAGYEADIMHDERFTGTGFADYDDRTGWRLGARYGQDNWLLAYEYRTYEGFNDFGNLNLGTVSRRIQFNVTIEIYNPTTNATVTTITPNTYQAPIGGWFNDAQVNSLETQASVFYSNAEYSDFVDAINLLTASSPSFLRPNNSATSIDYYSKLNYAVHRAGLQVKLGQFTTSAGYSLATQKLDLAGAADIDQTALAVDVAYHLGLNSLLAVGWKKVTTETWTRGGINSNYSSLNTTLDNVSRISRTQEATETTTQLYYRVDF